VRFFFGEAIPEPHSTRHIEEAVSWALETDAETLIATASPRRRLRGAAEDAALAQKVHCPALVLHGDDDRITPLSDGVALAAALASPLEVVAGAGHCVHVRHPVWFNARVRRFVEEVAAGARA
jgi:pimeloyl-ACP methyl ester carboxylesterase